MSCINRNSVCLCTIKHSTIDHISVHRILATNLNDKGCKQTMHIDMLILFLEFAVMTLFILMIGYPLLLIECILKALNLG